jgi:Co/Zn/Cd efflux system component
MRGAWLHVLTDALLSLQAIIGAPDHINVDDVHCTGDILVQRCWQNA